MLETHREFVVLVDQDDKKIGSSEKLVAHQIGLLHRAFSVFIFNKYGEVLVQQRALTKYHTPGLWSNTCCSHPYECEDVAQAAQRRLQEEMGFACPVREIFAFIYKHKFSNGLYEHEYDHVFIGHYDGAIVPNSQEVAAYKWIKPEDLLSDIQVNPERYTYWLKACAERVFAISCPQV